jgi:hypothetical protein
MKGPGISRGVIYLRFVNVTEPEGRFARVASSGFSLFSKSVSEYQRSRALVLSL